MSRREMRRLSILAAPAALALMAAPAVHAQIYTENQAQLLNIVDESSGFGDGGVVNSVTAYNGPAGNGLPGVIVSFNFDQLTAKGGNDGKNPWVPFDHTYFGPNLNLQAYTDAEQYITLLPGSGDASVDVQPFIQEGSPGYGFDGFSGPPGEDYSLAQGVSYTSDESIAQHPGAFSAGNDIRYGWQIFPQPVYSAYDPHNDPAELLLIQPVAVPEPATLGLLGLSVPALLARRRKASK